MLNGSHFFQTQTKEDDYPYNCTSIPLFELGSLHHDFYLLNLRLPVDTERQMNQHVGHVSDIWLAVSYKYFLNYFSVQLILIYNRTI